MPSHSAPPSLPIAVHYSAAMPVVRTACGLSRVPGTRNWPDVNCCACLATAPPYPGLAEQIERCRGRFRETT